MIYIYIYTYYMWIVNRLLTASRRTVCTRFSFWEIWDCRTWWRERFRQISHGRFWDGLYEARFFSDRNCHHEIWWFNHQKSCFCLENMGVSLKWGYRQIIHFSGIFPLKPCILGCPHLWKPPYDEFAPNLGVHQVHLSWDLKHFNLLSEMGETYVRPSMKMVQFLQCDDP